GDGRIGVSIGDVAGHGLEAAVAMGEARRAIRTAAAGFGSPSEMLDYVNGILPLHDGGGMPLGLALAVASPDWTITVDPGTSVVMYTDGLLEYSRDILAGERMLRETIAGTDLAATTAPAEALHAAIFSTV